MSTVSLSVCQVPCLSHLPPNRPLLCLAPNLCGNSSYTVPGEICNSETVKNDDLSEGFGVLWFDFECTLYHKAQLTILSSVSLSVLE